MKKIVVVLILMFSLASANEFKLGNLSVAYNSYDKSCFVMNDVDAFYVYKLMRRGDIKIKDVLNRNSGVITMAVEKYEETSIEYIFFNNMETCKKFKDKL